MQIEIDIEKIISRSIIDGILKNDVIQEDVNNILESDEYQKILDDHIKVRFNELLFSEEGKKQIDKGIIDGIVNSDKIQNRIEEILDGDEYLKILEQRALDCLHETISSEEGKRQIFGKVKAYLEGYDIEYDDNFSNELNKGVSDMLITMMKDSFKRLKAVNKQ